MICGPCYYKERIENVPLNAFVNRMPRAEARMDLRISKGRKGRTHAANAVRIVERVKRAYCAVPHK